MAFRPDPKRDAAAAILAQTAQTWPVVTLKKAHGAFPVGTRFYGIPSSTPGTHYLTNLQACSCPDYQERGANCKHQRAAVLFEQRLQQEAAAHAAPAPQPRKTYAQLTGGCERPGCPEDAIGKTGRCGAHFLTPLAV